MDELVTNENYALWQVKKGFRDKYTGVAYKIGEVAVFDRRRAKEIMSVIGEGGLKEVAMPEGCMIMPALLTVEADGTEIDAKVKTKSKKKADNK